METQNLWPDFPTEEMKGPKAILIEQAEYLKSKTKNMLSATIIPSSVPNDERIQYSFFIVAPLLNDYRYKLLTVSYEVATNYPLYLSWRYANDEKKTIYSEEEFIRELSSIFNDQHTVSIVSSLLSQSRAEQTE